ncbi:MAG TPA: SDR family oxidoreductase [Patescibacteria group bacterium]|nr:SDR family oxidoreductase [Patescibacteria group bacterium]
MSDVDLDPVYRHQFDGVTSRFVPTIGRDAFRDEFGPEILSDPDKIVVDPARIKDRVSIITGASSGVGKATALLLSELGSRVAVNGRDVARTNQVVDEIIAAGGDAIAVIGDLRDPEAAAKAVRETTERFGRIDIGVLNAAVLDESNPIEMTPEQWYAVHGNADLTFFPAQAIARQMLTQNNSEDLNMVYVSSISMVGNQDQPNYSFVKAGGEAMIKSFARSGSTKAIHFGIFRPGPIRTEMVDALDTKGQRAVELMGRRSPMGRLITPPEAARGIAYLATQKESGHILTLT